MIKSLLRTIAIGLACICMAVPDVDAQRQVHGSRHGTSQGSGHDNGGSRAPSRPSNNGGNSNRPSRPSNNGGNSNRPSRPSNNGGNSNRPSRPSNNGGNNNRPSRPSSDHRPSHPGWGTPPQHRPGHVGSVPPSRPHPGHGVGPAWNNGHHRPSYVHPPVRPFRPVARPWHRPVPPRSWRPVYHAPSLGTVLGIAFGTALNLSLDYLINGGYSIDGYGNNVVYLRDVNQYNYFWPDATFYYGTGGGFDRSEFIYSTSYPDQMRYRALYNQFMGIYGAPVMLGPGPNLSATWFAPNRGYITLQYAPQYSVGGGMRYFTTLTLGL